MVSPLWRRSFVTPPAPNQCRVSRRRRLAAEAPVAAAGEPLGERRQDGLGLGGKRPGRVRDEEPAAVEAVRRRGLVDHELEAQRLAGRGAGDDRGRAVDIALILDRIPAGEDAGRPFVERLCHLAGEALELARLLVGRIDEDEPAPLLCRDEGVQRRPAVEMEHLDLRVAPEAPRQDRPVLGVELDEHRPVLRPHQLAHDQRRARIGVAWRSRTVARIAR
jgi:hypothetical protein